MLGHVLRAYLALYGATAGGLELAAVALEEAERAADDLGEREVLHLRAARSWSDGDWVGASRWLERALLHEARDLLALRVAQDLYFFLGDRAGLLRVAEQVVPAWHPGEPGWGYVQGILAFGLEENAATARPSPPPGPRSAPRPDDVWAVHALAHVFEMEGRPGDGVRIPPGHRGPVVAELLRRAQLVAPGPLPPRAGRDRRGGGPLRRPDPGRRGSSGWLDLVDAAALLWRLSLFGVDVHGRAARAGRGHRAAASPSPIYVFNDWHAVMAFGLAGRHDLVHQVVEANRDRARGTNRERVDAVGLALLDGFGLFGEGRYGRAFDRLAEVHSGAHVVGGSHAQRDVIDLTLLAAAARAGRTAEVEHLAARRRRAKPSAAPAVGRLLAANAG